MPLGYFDAPRPVERGVLDGISLSALSDAAIRLSTRLSPQRDPSP